MDIYRRNFFGIIAAPLLRHIGPPPTPVAINWHAESQIVNNVINSKESLAARESFVRALLQNFPAAL